MTESDLASSPPPPISSSSPPLSPSANPSSSSPPFDNNAKKRTGLWHRWSWPQRGLFLGFCGLTLLSLIAIGTLVVLWFAQYRRLSEDVIKAENNASAPVMHGCGKGGGGEEDRTHELISDRPPRRAEAKTGGPPEPLQKYQQKWQGVDVRVDQDVEVDPQDGQVYALARQADAPESAKPDDIIRPGFYVPPLKPKERYKLVMRSSSTDQDDSEEKGDDDGNNADESHPPDNPNEAPNSRPNSTANLNETINRVLVANRNEAVRNPPESTNLERSIFIDVRHAPLVPPAPPPPPPPPSLPPPPESSATNPPASSHQGSAWSWPSWSFRSWVPLSWLGFIRRSAPVAAQGASADPSVAATGSSSGPSSNGLVSTSNTPDANATTAIDTFNSDDPNANATTTSTFNNDPTANATQNTISSPDNAAPGNAIVVRARSPTPAVVPTPNLPNTTVAPNNASALAVNDSNTTVTTTTSNTTNATTITNSTRTANARGGSAPSTTLDRSSARWSPLRLRDDPSRDGSGALTVLRTADGLPPHLAGLLSVPIRASPRQEPPEEERAAPILGYFQGRSGWSTSMSIFTGIFVVVTLSMLMHRFILANVGWFGG